jgi:NADH:ubiquinone oxidoreductase subunit 3 (subunit A)
MYFAQFFCGVNKKTYPFESRTRRRSPTGMKSVIKFFLFILHACLFSFEIFLLYGVL